MRLVEIRLLDGPNIYRLEPTLKLEIAVGRRRTWYGQRLPAGYAMVRLSRPARPSDAPAPIVAIAAWVRRLHRLALGRRVSVAIHETSDPGHWVVAFPWLRNEEAETIARAAWRLGSEGGRASSRTLRRIVERVRSAGGDVPAWITDERRTLRLVSVSGTNGKSTTARMITHICMGAGLHVGTTTTDGVLVDERLVEAGDYTGPQGARAVMRRPELDLGVLETARGGILLRGLGYQSNDVSVLTNVSADHLDLQGVHTLPELAEVKSVIARVTRPDGTVVLNADDPLVADVARRVTAHVVLFSLQRGNRRVTRHLRAGGTAFVARDGSIVELAGDSSTEIVPLADVPTTLVGLARHNVANALAAAAAARALGVSVAGVATGLRDFGFSPELMPGRLNFYRHGSRIVCVDYAHNEAGLEALLDTVEGLIGPLGDRRIALNLVIGTAGDRPDDSLRAMGRIAGERADRVAIKESLTFLRGRTRGGVVGELRAGLSQAGVPASEVAVYQDERSALAGELEASTDGMLVLMCHEQRDEVRDDLLAAGFTAVSDPRDLQSLRRGGE